MLLFRARAVFSLVEHGRHSMSSQDTKSLRACYYKAMSVKNAVPHPRTIALIQEIGGKMHASQRNFDEACQAFFQAFKSYDEAGDRSRLRCLNYLVMASMLHASSINPFDSHEARAHRDDPQIAAMTNLVQAFHNDDIKKFEQILKKVRRLSQLIAFFVGPAHLS